MRGLDLILRPLGYRALQTVIALVVAAAGAIAHAACPPACAGATLITPNFSHQDLTNADFSNATLVGPVFIRAKLSGAKFDGATLSSSPDNAMQTPDFSFADLTNATFVNTHFTAPTYFTYATLTCTDFSDTHLNDGTAIFGDEPLAYVTQSTCRPKFVGATMNCEFIDDWHALDLTNAIVTACLGQLSNRNFSNAMMSGVNFGSAILDGTSFASAHLESAQFKGASLQCYSPPTGNTVCVDMSNALLQNATLDNANLSGATLYGAFLSNNVNGNISQAASMQQAHLKNVNLAFAQLSGVSMQLSNIYSTTPANGNTCSTSQSNYAGFTSNCSSLHHATMTGTTANDTYMYGVDLTEASISGVDFSDAVLAGADFSGASISPIAGTGNNTLFTRAYLQGTNLDQATTVFGANLKDAYLDFRNGGNILYINLNGTNHNSFACSTPSTCVPDTGADVCVWVRYPTTTVPSTNTTLRCPNDDAGPCGDPSTAQGNAAWKSSLLIETPPSNPGPPPGWYTNDATYEPRAPSALVCNNRGSEARTIDW